MTHIRDRTQTTTPLPEIISSLELENLAPLDLHPCAREKYMSTVKVLPEWGDTILFPIRPCRPIVGEPSQIAGRAGRVKVLNAQNLNAPRPPV